MLNVFVLLFLFSKKKLFTNAATTDKMCQQFSSAPRCHFFAGMGELEKSSFFCVSPHSLRAYLCRRNSSRKNGFFFREVHLNFINISNVSGSNRIHSVRNYIFTFYCHHHCYCSHSDSFFWALLMRASVLNVENEGKFAICESMFKSKQQNKGIEGKNPP